MPVAPMFPCYHSFLRVTPSSRRCPIFPELALNLGKQGRFPWTREFKVTALAQGKTNLNPVFYFQLTAWLPGLRGSDTGNKHRGCAGLGSRLSKLLSQFSVGTSDPGSRHGATQLEAASSMPFWGCQLQGCTRMWPQLSLNPDCPGAQALALRLREASCPSSHSPFSCRGGLSTALNDY